jgi:hypothetical protein
VYGVQRTMLEVERPTLQLRSRGLVAAMKA